MLSATVFTILGQSDAWGKVSQQPHRPKYSGLTSQRADSFSIISITTLESQYKVTLHSDYTRLWSRGENRCYNWVKYKSMYFAGLFIRLSLQT